MYKGSGGPLQEIVLPSINPFPAVGLASPRASQRDSKDEGKTARTPSFSGSLLKRGASRRESKSSIAPSPRSSNSLIDTVDFLKEAYLFIFNDLFLFCRPCKTLGRKGQVKRRNVCVSLY